jgi:hypothetical protein
MKRGDEVTVPARLNALAGGRETAVLISSSSRPGPSVLQGPKTAPIVMWRVRYSDRAVEEVPEGAIAPVDAPSAPTEPDDSGDAKRV